MSFSGIAGQSFGAWTAAGVTLDLEGEGNDYVGKGLSGGRIIVRPPAQSAIVPEDSIIVGNTAMYGAISGECFFRGVAGERFAVRNSGALAVVAATFLNACTYTVEQQAEEPAGWQQHLENNRTINAWSIQARLGIQSETEGGSFDLHWQQEQQPCL